MGDVGENATLETVRFWIIKLEVFPESAFSILSLPSFEIPSENLLSS
jgi:hypothetical protein